MAHNAEPMDIDDISEFDNKENSFHHNNVRQSTEKGYEELDVSELNMKLRYSFTPASSPMSKSYAGSLDNRSQDSDDLNNTVNNENDNLTHSLNSSVTKNETLVKTPKLLPLQALPSEQFADGTRNAPVLRPLDGTITVEDDKDITVTVTEAIDSDENISIPSTSSSPVCTPEATTPVKDAPKPTGSPIMRGLKTVLNMFRQSQSPSDENIQNLNEVTRTGNETLFGDQSIAQFAVASTPIAANKKERDGSTTRSSPLKESMSFKEDLEKEIKWNDDSTIIFSNKEKIPIHKLLFPPTKPTASDISNASINLGAGPNVTNVADNLNKTVEPMDVSYNDSILRDKTMTEVQTDTLLLATVNEVKEFASETDESLFLDCETTLNETELLSDTKDDIAAVLPAKDNKLEKMDSIPICNNTTDFSKEEINEVVGGIKPQNMDSGHKDTINNEAPSKNINIAEDLAPFPDNLDDNTPNTPTNVSVRSKTIDFIIESSVAFKQDKVNTFEECLNTDVEVSKQILDHIVVNTKTETPLNETIDLIKVSEIPLPSDDEFDDAYLELESVKAHYVLTDLNTIPEYNDSVLNKDVLDVQNINSETILANDEIRVPEVISSNFPESPMPADVADSVLINNTFEKMPVSVSLAENKDNVNTPEDKTESENKIVENLNVLTQVHILESEKTASVEIINDFNLNVADKVPEVIAEGVDNAGIGNYETALSVPPVKQLPQNKEENDLLKAVNSVIVTETKIAQSSGSLIVDVSTEKDVTENIQTVTGIQFSEPSDKLQLQIQSQNNEDNLVNVTAQELKPEFIEYATTESEINDVTQNVREVPESESNQETTDIAAIDKNETKPTVVNFLDKNIGMVSQDNKENDALNTTQDLQTACIEKCDLNIGETKTTNNAETMNDKLFSVPSDLIQETDNAINFENYHTNAELDNVATETVPQNNKDNVMNTTQVIDPVLLEPHVIDNTESCVTEATNASEAKQDFVDVQTNVQSIVEPVVTIDENDIPLNNQCYLKNISTFDSKIASEEPIEISMVELAKDIVGDKNTEMNQLMDTTKITTDQPFETETDDLEDELILSESNSPYVSLTAQSDNPPEPPVESFENVRMSPPICSKGYNINFDDLDNVNPFISKKDIRMSPPASASLNQTFEPIDKIVSSEEHSHEEVPKETVLINECEKRNESTTVESNTLNITKSLTEEGDITFCSNKISNLDIKNVEPVYDHVKEMLQEEISKKIAEQVTDDVISVTNNTNEETVLPLSGTEALEAGSRTKHQEQQKQNPIEEKEIVISEVVTKEQASTSHSSLEQSTYFSAESSGPDKIGYTLPDFDEINMNPFATKTKMRQSPQPELVLEDPFATKSKIASSPITAPTTLNVTVNLDDHEKDKDEIQITNNTSIYDQKSIIEDKDVTSNDDNTNCSGSSSATDEKNVTVQELHTDAEETVEGPFIDAELGDDVDKMSEFESEKVEFNEFTDLPTQETDENFEAGEMFIDADAFEFLMNQNKSNGVDDNGKESLFLKFDPLFSKRVNSDGVLDVLSKLQKRQSTPKKMRAPPPPPPQDLMVLENSPVAGPSHVHEGYVTPDESSDELNVTVSQKPTMAVPPAVNPVVVPRKKATTPVRTTSRMSMNFTSPAMTVIDRLLSLSGAFSPETTNVTTPQISGEQYEADRALVQLRELLAEKELNVHHLRGESKELRDRLAILETQMSTLEKEGEKRLKYINELNTKLAETNKENKGMASVVEEYERTIAGLIAGIEEDKKRHAEERTLLINDRDEQTAHLASMEVAFSDLHSKYEKSKQVIMSYKAKEDTYRQSIQEFEVNLEKMQNNYELLKQHATSKLNHANTELEKINRSHESEVLKLNAMIKRKDLHISSLEETLAQKTKANEELTAICDELINKVG